MIHKPFVDLVHSFAAKTPTPGGGAAAAMTACVGTALLLMVVRFTRGKKATLDHDERLAGVEKQLEQYLERLLPMAERDCASFDHVSKAYALPKETPDEQGIRARAIEEGMVGAMVVPEETLCMVRDVLAIISTVASLVGRNIISDLGSGVELLVASAESANFNVRINASFLEAREKAAAALQRNDVVMTDVRAHQRTIRALVDKHLP